MLPCPDFVNSAVVNIGMHVCFRIMVFSRYIPRNAIAGSYGTNFSKIFFDPFLRVMKMKANINKWDLNLKVLRSKGNQRRKESSKWEKIFANEAPDKEYIPKYTNSS